jgi:hypothetical protein
MLSSRPYLVVNTRIIDLTQRLPQTERHDDFSPIKFYRTKNRCWQKFNNQGRKKGNQNDYSIAQTFNGTSIEKKWYEHQLLLKYLTVKTLAIVKLLIAPRHYHLP